MGKKRSYKKKSDGTKALKLVRQIKRDIETKFKDYSGIQSPDFSGQYTLFLGDIAQGLLDTNRIGDDISLVQFILRYDVFAGTTAGSIRVIIIYDKSNSVGLISDILQVTGTIQSVHSAFHKDHRKEFIVLYDKTTSVSVNGPNEKNFIRTINLKNKKTKFQAGTTTINTGRIKMAVITGTNIVAEQPGFNFFARITYTDM